MTTDTSESSDLLRRAGQGDAQALGKLLEAHRKRLRRMVRLRLDPRLQGVALNLGLAYFKLGDNAKTIQTLASLLAGWWVLR